MTDLTPPAAGEPDTSPRSGPGLVLLVASPRVVPGVLSRAAWQALEAAEVRLARDLSDPLAGAVLDAGLTVEAAGGATPGEVAAALLDRAALGPVLWVGSADGDPGLTDALTAEIGRRPGPTGDQFAAGIEVLVGSWDVPGARLLDAVAVMDRLRSPGGCPWDAEQTHQSLAPYLIEEAHEVLEAVQDADPGHLAEELGDVLLQVLFHARVAEESETAPFDIDDVAGGLVAKLVRRHPHVFADGDASTPEEVEQHWERIKADERAARAAADAADTEDGQDDTGTDRGAGSDAGAALLHGIPASLPALLAADKVLARLRRGGAGLPQGEGTVGEQLLALVAQARDQGLSAEIELRATLASLTGATGQ
jgi:XTP/dITP diphosphohydrolase